MTTCLGKVDTFGMRYLLYPALLIFRLTSYQMSASLVRFVSVVSRVQKFSLVRLFLDNFFRLMVW